VRLISIIRIITLFTPFTGTADAGAAPSGAIVLKELLESLNAR
jgi:hypothetical protein